MDDKKADGKITIDLNETEGHVFSSGHIIHHKEMDRALGHIRKGIAKASSKDSELGDKEYPSHNAILVEGGRGAGKTSFLHSLEKECAKDDSKENNIRENAYCLPFLDPTLIEEKAHIFLTIISLIKEAAKKHHDAASKDDDECASLQGKCEIESRLEKLAKGLPSVAGKEGMPDYWDNASLILHKGLDDVSAAFHLREMFVEAVNSALEELGKKVFILFIDDVDTDFSKTLPLLETLRKYLTTDKIITVISGDFRLISAAVRGKQWENFGKTLLDNDCNSKGKGDSKSDGDSGRRKYSCYVSELESQYLQKIFRSEIRIKLRSLNEVVSQEEGGVSVAWTGKNEGVQCEHKDGVPVGIPIREVYANAFATLGMKNARERGAYTQFILGLSVRTQIQMLKALWRCASKSGTEASGAIDSRAFTSIFMTYLVNKDVDIDKILANDAFLTIEMLKFLCDNHVLNEYYQLEPTAEDDSINGCITALSVLFSLDVKGNPAMLFDYALRIPYMRNLMQTIESGGKNDSGEAFSIDGLAKYAGMYTNRDYRQMLCYATAYLCSALGEGTKSGVIELESLHSRSKKRITGADKNKFDVKIGDYSTGCFGTGGGNGESVQIPYALKAVGHLPLSTAFDAGNNKYEDDYSVFTLLASVADVIKDAAVKKEAGEEMSYPDTIERLSQPKTYPMPRTNDNSKYDDESGNVEAEPHSAGQWDGADKVIAKWVEYAASLPSVPTYLISKIITRCYFAFLDIRAKNLDKDLADLMHLFVCQIIHAAIVEESIEQQSKKNGDKNKPKADKDSDSVTGEKKDNGNTLDKMEMNNIVSSIRVLKSNLKKANLCNTDDGEYPVTKMLITCPLLIAFVKKDGDNNILDGDEDEHTIVEINKKLLGKDEMGKYIVDGSPFYNGELYKALQDIRQKQRTFPNAFMAFGYSNMDANIAWMNMRGISYEYFMDENRTEELIRDLKLIFINPPRVNKDVIIEYRKRLKEQEKKW